jgi:hypothetical protein
MYRDRAALAVDHLLRHTSVIQRSEAVGLEAHSTHTIDILVPRVLLKDSHLFNHSS